MPYILTSHLTAPLWAALALFPLGGLARRIAGGVLNEWFRPNGPRVFGDFPARAIFGFTMAVAAVAAGVPLWAAVLVIGGVFLGCAIPNKFTLPYLGEFGGIDLGYGDHLPLWRGVLGLALHGALGFALVAVPAWYLGYAWWITALGAVMIVPAYMIGWAMPWYMPVGFSAGFQRGEWIWGSLMYIAVFLTGAFHA